MPEEPKPTPTPAAEAVPAAGQAKPSPPAPVEPAELVRFEKVTKSFGTGPAAKVAVQNVSFVVHDQPNSGELIAIVGPSGCGKSTVLRMLAGLLPHHPPTTGEVWAFGKRIAGPSAERGMVDQKYSLMPHLTVADNIAFGLKLRGVAGSERRDRAHDWAKKVGLEGSEDKYPSELSGGMQQRVAIARALVFDPPVVLADEPTGNLDTASSDEVFQELRRMHRERSTSFVIVTHDPRLAARCDRVVELVDGAIARDEPVTASQP